MLQGKYWVEIDLVHLRKNHEDLADALLDAPGEILPYVSEDAGVGSARAACNCAMVEKHDCCSDPRALLTQEAAVMLCAVCAGPPTADLSPTRPRPPQMELGARELVLAIRKEIDEQDLPPIQIALTGQLPDTSIRNIGASG